MSGEQYTSSSDKVNLIEVRIKTIHQLFNSMDPSPFLEKDLDPNAFEYIVSSVSEHSSKTKHKILIHLPLNQKKKISETEIIRSIRNYFEYKSELAKKKIRLTLKEGEYSFIIGFIVLFGCLGLRNFLLTLHDTPLLHILTEGLLVGSWVAMWKPVSNILYDWWPVWQEKIVYDKVANMDIEFRYE